MASSKRNSETLIRTARLAVPFPAKMAVAALIAYALLVVTQAITFAAASDFSDAMGFARALVRGAGVVFVSMYVLKLQRWAWYFAVIGSAVLLVFSLSAIPFLIALALDDELPLGWMSLLFAGAMTVALFLGLVGLTVKVSRQVFLGPP